MKKIKAFLLTAFLCFMLAGCSDAIATETLQTPAKAAETFSPIGGNTQVLVGTTNGLYALGTNRIDWDKKTSSNGMQISFVIANDGSLISGSYRDSQGIWKSSDGVSWTQTSITTDGWKALCVLPDGSILAGSLQSDRPGGIWKSTDNGNRWTVTGKTDGAWSDIIALSDGSVLAGSFDKSSGIWKSTDNGDTWTQTSMKTTWQIGTLVELKNGTVLAADFHNPYIWQSLDKGNTWSILNSEYEYWGKFLQLLDGSILAASSGSSQKGIYKSDDNGKTWKQTQLSSGSWNSLVLLSDGSILAGSASYNGSGVWRSTDNGDTWHQTKLNDANVYAIIER